MSWWGREGEEEVVDSSVPVSSAERERDPQMSTS